MLKKFISTDFPAKFVTAPHLASILGVSPKTVFRWAAKGKIPHLRIAHTVRFQVNEVLAALQSGEQAE